MSAIHGNAIVLGITMMASRKRLDILGGWVIRASLNVIRFDLRNWEIMYPLAVARRIRAPFINGREVHSLSTEKVPFVRPILADLPNFHRSTPSTLRYP